MICPTCGRVGTTIVTQWDGEKVFFECRRASSPGRRAAARAAGSRRSAGAAKLPWNLEWAAQWSLFGVTIEPNGKDLATAGGSRDRSEAIAREVFEREPPINIPYEFLNIGGKKMSTSKGLGASATQMAEVVPPEQLRLLFLRPASEPRHRVRPVRDRRRPAPVRRVRPAGRRRRRPRREGRPAAGLRARLPLLAPRPGRRRRRRGGAVPVPVRAPGDADPDPGRRRRSRSARGEKGDALDRPSAADPRDSGSSPRAPGSTCSPRTTPRSRSSRRCPRRPRELDDTGATFPRRARRARRRAGRSGPVGADGEAWQAAIFETATEGGLKPGTAFRALYLAFLGRPNGPRAGWLLAKLEPEFVVARLREAAAGGTLPA